ncbi:MAG: diguanylate cyclase [Oscillospiraceae bacterium]|nr:diguanylate cyclase [Oscillospiraceae bacterium]
MTNNIESARKRAVLIVDDENSNIIALNSILSGEYTTYAAKSGAAAIAAAEKYAPDVILLDIIMPDMDGYEVITVLKSTELTKDIPVIFITGLRNSEDEEKGLSLGAADYISKPFSSAIVKLRLRNQIMILEQLRIIERLSMTDRLTELPNRRFFETQMNSEWRRAKREKIPISVLMIDVDNFKHYNDTYGHQQGDVALCTVAEVFRQVLKRSGDFAARWGGEEFVVLLPNTDLQGAKGVAEQLRAQVEEVPIRQICNPDQPPTRITISIGVNAADTKEQGETTVYELIGGADKALYSAKNAGRNCVSSNSE